MPTPFAATALTAALGMLLLISGCSRGEPTNPQDQPVTSTRTTTTPASEIAFDQQEPWASSDVEFDAKLDFDQPTTQPERAEAHKRVRAVYTTTPDPRRLVLDVYAISGTRHRDAPRASGPDPLSGAAQIQVFGEDRTAPLAAFTRAQLAYATAESAGFQHDGLGPILRTLERVRVPLGPQAAAILGAHPYKLTAVALDAQGRTMAVVDIEGDEADEPIAPLAVPEGGWNTGPLPAEPAKGGRPTSSNGHGAAGKALPRTPGGPRFAVGDLQAQLPESIPGWTRFTSLEKPGDTRIDRHAGERAEADYRRGDVELTVRISDAGEHPTIPAATAPAERRDTGVGHLTITRLGARLVEQRTEASSGRAGATVRLANGIVVSALGRNQDLPQLVEVLEAIDLGAIEVMARP